MAIHALIVEDDRKVCESITDILDSLGHGYDCASCQEAAEVHLAKNDYTYVILDLEIPYQDHRLARTQNGENLMLFIRATPRTCDLKVLVATAHGSNEPTLAVRLMRLGATHFVNKPFENGKLDRAIREMLTSDPATNHLPANPSLAPKVSRRFEGGTLVVHDDRMDLCDVTIVRKTSRSLAWKVMQVLGKRKPDGRSLALSGNDLAAELGLPGEQNTIAQCIRLLRNKFKSKLASSGIDCGHYDVILSGREGYRLHPSIEVQEERTDLPTADPRPLRKGSQRCTVQPS